MALFLIQTWRLWKMRLLCWNSWKMLMGFACTLCTPPALLQIQTSHTGTPMDLTFSWKAIPRFSGGLPVLPVCFTWNKLVKIPVNHQRSDLWTCRWDLIDFTIFWFHHSKHWCQQPSGERRPSGKRSYEFFEFCGDFTTDSTTFSCLW